MPRAMGFLQKQEILDYSEPQPHQLGQFWSPGNYQPWNQESGVHSQLSSGRLGVHWLPDPILAFPSPSKRSQGWWTDI